jgi:hypothetical protein
MRWFVLAIAAAAPLLPASSAASTPPDMPQSAWHYTANGNFDAEGTYLPGADGFNLADITSNSQALSLPAGVEGLVWVGLCGGVDSSFKAAVTPTIGDPRVFGFYLMDEPDPSVCPAVNLKAEADWIHANDPGTVTFIILQNMGPTSAPIYAHTYNPANTDIDLFGLDPYPCRSELGGSCNDTWIGLAVAAAQDAGIPSATIVPVYQTFGGGSWTDDGGGSYSMPTPTQLTGILATWASLVPTPAFDYAYSWGDQHGDTALGDNPGDAAVFAAQYATTATAPAMPDELGVSRAGRSQISVAFASPPGGASGYGYFLDGTKVGSGAATLYTFTGLSCGKTYALGVDAFDSDGTRSGIRSIDASTRACRAAVQVSASISRAAIAGGSCATFFYATNIRTWNMLAVIGPGGGRIVRLTRGWERSGLHSWRWCGRRSDGARVKPGVYTIRISVRLSAGSAAAVAASAKRSLAVR